MKNVMTLVLVLLISASVFILGFDNKKASAPNTYYQVYLKEETIGIVKSKKELEEYIDDQGVKYKKKYGVNAVYAPNDMKVVKITTFNDQVSSVKDVYKKIMERSPFTIDAYKVTIKPNNTETSNTTFYVTNKDVLKDALEYVIVTFVGEERYNSYLNDTQAKIVTTGKIIENVYISNNITTKYEKVSVTEKIYSNEKDLMQLLIFGESNIGKAYVVKSGDTISSIALENQISVGEFLISNASLKSENSLLFPGQLVNIIPTSPKVSVVIKEYVVEDIPKKFTVQESIDENRLQGDDERIQVGENGLDRVAWSDITVNNEKISSDTISNEEIKPAVNEIWIRGGKIIPNVGSLKVWAWPTESGYRITQDYAWRINPIRGNREFHQAIDISGTGYGSNIYAANNGTVIKRSYEANGYGNYLIINHNNGYYTVYAHLSAFNVKVGQTVARGQIIAKMGSTGLSTGTHLHFEVKRGTLTTMIERISPWTFYKR